MLNTTMKELASSAFAAVQGFTKSIRWHHMNGASYATSSGAAVVNHDVFKTQAIVSAYRDSEYRGEQVLQGDRKIIFPAANAGTVRPNANDKIELDGDMWSVISVSSDPAEATYTLQVRRQ